MGGLHVLLFVMLLGTVVAERKPTVAEKLREDADLSQVFKFSSNFQFKHLSVVSFEFNKLNIVLFKFQRHLQSALFEII